MQAEPVMPKLLCDRCRQPVAGKYFRCTACRFLMCPSCRHAFCPACKAPVDGPYKITA